MSSRKLPDPHAEPTITVERVAAILSLGRRTAYAAIERGEIPSIRVGRRIVVPTARFLAAFDLAAPLTSSEARPASLATAHAPEGTSPDEHGTARRPAA